MLKLSFSNGSFFKVGTEHQAVVIEQDGSKQAASQ